MTRASVAPPAVGVVLVNYNGKRFLKDCLRALAASSYPPAWTVIVDNHSTDGSLADAEEFDSVVTLPQPSNLGIAAANNVGAQWCLANACDYVLFLNVDTLIETRCIEQLVAASSETVLVSGLTVEWDRPDVSNSHAGGFDWFTGRLRERICGARVESLGRHPMNFDFVDTCCLLVPRAALARVGPMDEAIFMYYDDSDFVARAREAGYSVVVAPAARLRHYERGSSGAPTISPLFAYYSTRNRFYFMRKHRPSRRAWWVFASYFLLTRSTASAAALLRGRAEVARWMLRGVADGVRGRMGAMNVRVVQGRQ
ncbi:MAG: glycosyltransferase family 2 protein [Vicinamibacterales bacterium]